MSPTGTTVYAITEGRANQTNFLQQKNDIIEKARKAAACGVTHLQIREKDLSAVLQLDLTRSVVEAAAGTGVRILVNGRFDIALAAGADGVHLPADGLPVDAVRRHVPEGFLIGVSTHSVEKAVAAKRDGADMIVFGPVFESPGKGDGVGLEILREVCRAAAPSPVLALGGIHENNFRLALGAGASGFAAIRFLNAVIERGERIAI
jgi:thiamine-phosphate pyrophosphorylase